MKTKADIELYTDLTDLCLINAVILKLFWVKASEMVWSTASRPINGSHDYNQFKAICHNVFISLKFEMKKFYRLLLSTIWQD